MLIKASEQETKSVDITSAYEMLMDESKLGSRFKLLAVFSATIKLIHQKYPSWGLQPPIHLNGEAQ